MASASFTARRVRRSSPNRTAPKVRCAHTSGDIVAFQLSMTPSLLSPGSIHSPFSILPLLDSNFVRTSQDKHKAPSSTPHRPLSLQDGGDASVPTDIITLFGRQKSAGRRGRKRPNGQIPSFDRQ